MCRPWRPCARGNLCFVIDIPLPSNPEHIAKTLLLPCKRRSTHFFFFLPPRTVSLCFFISSSRLHWEGAREFSNSCKRLSDFVQWRVASSAHAGRISALTSVDRTHGNVIRASRVWRHSDLSVSRLANRHTTETIRCGSHSARVPLWDLIYEIDVKDRMRLCTRLTNLSPSSCLQTSIRSRSQSKV